MHLFAAPRNWSPCQEKGRWLLRGKLKFQQRRTHSSKQRSLSNRQLCLTSTLSTGFKPCREDAGFSLPQWTSSLTLPPWLSPAKFSGGFSSQWKKTESHLQQARNKSYKTAQFVCGWQGFATHHSHSAPTEKRGAIAACLVPPATSGAAEAAPGTRLSRRPKRTQLAAYCSSTCAGCLPMVMESEQITDQWTSW